MSRPSLYEQWRLDGELEDKLILVTAWARDGLTHEQIASNLGIYTSTLYAYKSRHKEFDNALKKGKEVVDFQVENALLKRAMGYDYEEITQERISDTSQKKRHKGESELTEKDWDFAQMYFQDTCCYCGASGEITKDHLTPFSMGGKLDKMNIVPCCRACNSSKNDNEWLSWYQAQNFYSARRAEKIQDYLILVATMAANKQPDETLVVTKIVKKHMPADVAAAFIWLKNRKTKTWRDRPEESPDAVISAYREQAKGYTDEQLQAILEGAKNADPDATT